MLELILLSLILTMLVVIGVVLILFLKSVRAVDVSNRSIYTIVSLINRDIRLNQEQLRAVAEANGLEWYFPKPELDALQKMALGGQRLGGLGSKHPSKHPKLQSLIKKVTVEPKPSDSNGG